MNLRWKYLELSFQENYHEYPVRMHIDWFLSKPNLKFNWRDNASFHFEVGMFGKVFIVEFKWGHIRRQKNERELQTEADVQKFINAIQNHTENQ